jgi:predicted ATPase
VRPDLPSGTVTFLFTDVEGSTKLLHELGAARYAGVLEEHRRALREAFDRHDGVEVDTQGDAFFVAFPTAPAALEAAAEAQSELALPVRMGIHTGTPLRTEEGYVGADVHRAARIAAAGHGGQVLVSASAETLLDGELKDLGEHRLKDLSSPERIYQLGDDDFPPLKTLYRTNLPVPATPFLGRERELAEVEELLARDDVRLLTLSGPGGTGKTRLGLQAAAQASDQYPGGVFWVPLAPLRDPELVFEQAGQAVGARDGLAEAVGDKRLLLLLDNFEHVIAAAVELDALRARCPNLNVLVTSRELLGLPGEHAYAVPPLEPEEGTDLFLARARAAKSDFEPDEAVTELCERLDNLPLALELAAARVRILSPRQLLERLSDRLDLLKGGRGMAARQQTLRATIEWSYDLLKEEEQQLFARLAVFAGGCTPKAAEHICDADLDTLQSLVDKSLVRVRDEGRFWMLETIREYALERLEASGEAEDLRRQHAGYFLALTEEAERHLWNEEPEWLDRLAQEYDNVRAAMDRLEAHGEWQLVLRTAGAIGDFWGMKGYLREASRRLERALAADTSPTIARAKALSAAADTAGAQGESAATRKEFIEEALELYRQLRDVRGEALALFELGHLAADQGEYALAEEHAEECIPLARESGDEKLVLYGKWLLGWACKGLGELERAQRLDEEVSEEALAIGAKSLRSMTLEALSDFPIMEGRPEKGIRILAEAFRVNREMDDTWRLPLIASRLAFALAAAGRAADAARVLSSGLALMNETGADPAWIRDRNERTCAAAREQLGDHDFDAAWGDGLTLHAADAIERALAATSDPV